MIEEKFTPTTPLLDRAKFVGVTVNNGDTVIDACPNTSRYEDLQIPTLRELMTAPSLEIWEDSSADESAEGWKIFVKRAKQMAKHFSPHQKSTTRPGVKIRGMSSLKNKKKRKRVQKKVRISEEDEYEQPERVPITLTEFLPVEFFSNEFEVEEEISHCHMVSVVEYEADTENDETNVCSGPSVLFADKAQQNEDAIPSKTIQKSKAKENKVSSSKMTSPREVPPSSSKERDQKPDIGKTNESSQSHALCASCLSTITFGEDDFLLGSEFHNRPLYVTGEVGGTTINRILLDCGSAVNLIPLKTLHAIGMSIQQLSPSMLTIQGFNQLGQKAMGSIALQMEIGDLHSDALFHVIDADTSYNVLLGRPWLHAYGIIPSTLHQCFKYLVDGEVKRVLADTDPFKSEEVNYSDAKFYGPSGLSFTQPSKVDEDK